MNTKSKIKAFFDLNQENVLYIEKYEENINLFNNLLKNGYIEDIDFVLSIKIYKYVCPLSNTGNYAKAIRILEEIDVDLVKLKGKSKWYSKYLEVVTLYKGICLGRLKKYRDSNAEFKKLLIKNPDNNNYIDWYKSNRKSEISRIFDRVTRSGVVFYLVILFAEFLECG
jgi:tetratricopeptide (TPR) repeat protein